MSVHIVQYTEALVHGAKKNRSINMRKQCFNAQTALFPQPRCSFCHINVFLYSKLAILANAILVNSGVSIYINTIPGRRVFDFTNDSTSFESPINKYSIPGL